MSDHDPNGERQRNPTYVYLLLGFAILLFSAASTLFIFAMRAGSPSVRPEPGVSLSLPASTPIAEAKSVPATPTPQPSASVAKISSTATTALRASSSPTTAPPVNPTDDEAARVRAVMKSIVQVRTDRALGTGFLVRRNGNQSWFITNRHVVEGASKVSVVTPDGHEHVAANWKRDSSIDLAAIEVDALPEMPVVTFGNPSQLQLADPLYVIGYALGDNLLGDPTMTRGVVSGRRVAGTVNYLQTDAAMNPGNSGGPVIDSNGHVVGVATMTIRDIGDTPIQGINFAIPADTVQRVMNSLIA